LLVLRAGKNKTSEYFITEDLIRLDNIFIVCQALKRRKAREYLALGGGWSVGQALYPFLKVRHKARFFVEFDNA